MFSLPARWGRKFFIAHATVLVALLFAHSNTFANDNVAATAQPPVRKFNDVLKDLLNEFAYDLKTNQVQGLKNLAVRRVALSESIPKSYENYLENLTLERVRKYSKIRVMQCTMCRVKKTMVENGKLIMTMPINNQTELDTLANQLNIETWMDVTLLYQESGMVLAYNAFDSKTKELLWTKTYNSEDLNKQVEEATKGDDLGKKIDEEPASTYVTALSMGWYMVANVKKPSNMLAFSIRMSEQFNGKRSEIGGMVTAVVDPNMIVSDYAAEGDPSASDEVTVNNETQVVRPFPFGVALFATYHHNFGKVGETDSFRAGAHGGIGGIYAPGYITFTGRAGPNFKFGRRFFIEVGVNYSMPTTLTLKEQFSYKTKGGVGADATFGVYF